MIDESVRNKIIETIEDMSIVSRFADWLESEAEE